MNQISKPVLQWEIASLVAQGFTEIILTVSHMADQIQSYFGDGQKFGCTIQYFVEETPLGNAFTLFKMRIDLRETFLLLNADAVFDVDFIRMVEYHKTNRSAVTLFTHSYSHPYDLGLIIASEDGSVEYWRSKENTGAEYYKNRVNAGLYVIDLSVLDMAIERTGLDVDLIGTTDEQVRKVFKYDLERQILKPL